MSEAKVYKFVKIATIVIYSLVILIAFVLVILSLVGLVALAHVQPDETMTQQDIDFASKFKNFRNHLRISPWFSYSLWFFPK